MKWLSIENKPFYRYGFNDGKSGITARMPESIAKTVNEGVAGAYWFSAGCRVRFKTNSPRIGIKVKYGKILDCIESPRLRFGFVLYASKENREIPVHMFYPDKVGEQTEYEATAEFDRGEEREYTLVFPCFSQVLSCDIGIEDDAEIGEGKAYANNKPVIFYGSSITNGAGASNPGNIYEQMISRAYNMDYVNLGFAGWAKGEKEMAEYIANMDMCAFVCDYDHNAPNVEHLKNTYPTFYEVVRKSHADIPYIIISKPDFRSDREKTESENKGRRDYIRSFYEDAKSKGDKNIYFIDGETFFPDKYNLSCTVDLCHPNDLGFHFMAEKIGAVLAEILGL